MASPGAGDHRITAAEAAALTRRHREGPGGKGPGAFTFGRAAFDALLAQEGCVGIRIYLGRGEDGATTLVMVGTDASGADLAEGEVMNRVLPCPPFCDLASPLAG
jgi:hypothetical protein